MSNELRLRKQHSSARPVAPAAHVVGRHSELQRLLARLARKEHLSRKEAADLTDALLTDGATDAKIAATLVALAMNGPSVDELTGMAMMMRSRAVRIDHKHERAIDTAGTGSSDAKTFNVSTAAIFVVAGAGLPVAKHGNRAATSCTGSADVLNALGVNISASQSISTRCLNELDLCFIFAPLYHPATARVAAIRRELPVFTPFNLLGPLTNPAGASYQIVGVAQTAWAELIAQTLTELGTRRAWVVHGRDGLDEVTLATETDVVESFAGKLTTFQITPEDFGLKRSSLAGLRCESTEQSAATVRAVLSGARRDAARDLVVINAAAGLYMGEMAADLKDARRLAEQSIDEGAAFDKLEQLVQLTNEH